MSDVSDMKEVIKEFSPEMFVTSIKGMLASSEYTQFEIRVTASKPSAPKVAEPPANSVGVAGAQGTANSESEPLICECGDHITGDYAFVGGKYLCPVCMEW